LSDNENTEDLSKSEFEGGSGDPEIIFQPDLGSESDSEFRVKIEVGYPSLEEAMDIKFDLNDVTNIQQRLRNLNCQPRNVKDLYPAPFHLLTKREKRCKDCHKFVIKPNINPTSNEKMKADFQMVYYVPKCMIYRTGKYTPYKGLDQDIEMMLKFINTEDTQRACISFSKIEEVFEEEKKQSDESPTKDTDTIPFNEDKIKVSQTLNADMELPVG
jgi:hypothetical protein